ncbi:MAG TPA: hypothetical protein VGS07_09430 [Thermoanaerobaculia bacterium]|jgi:hypothetical protein|nr:hypothetical protein [Thermoanaerobaculia bacterium]
MRSSVALALSLVFGGWFSMAYALPAGEAASAPRAAVAPQSLVPVGDVSLNIDTPQIEEKMGGAFTLGLRSGANNCYVAALAATPGQEGSIDFVVKPPAGEGRFLVTLNKKGSLGDGLVGCVRSVFDYFYHYKDKVAFDAIPGTLRFTPHTVSAPPAPTEAELRAVLDAQYAAAKVVRVAKAVQSSVSLDAGSSTEVFRRYLYAVDLEFVADGYEAVCRHYEPYKVFSARPYTTPYAGHVCESKAHKAADHTSDTVVLAYRLALYPAVGAAWELRVGGITGTRPAE